MGIAFKIKVSEIIEHFLFLLLRSMTLNEGQGQYKLTHDTFLCLKASSYRATSDDDDFNSF